MSILATDSQHHGRRLGPRLARWALVLVIAAGAGALLGAVAHELGWRDAPALTRAVVLAAWGVGMILGGRLALRLTRRRPRG